MHLLSLSLRNYRVYRSVDLEFPDGLIGIYGANGSGKTTLIESLRFALYGDSRTDKWELRSAGVGDDVRVELVFEHEGNTFDVRRRLKGRNLTPEVEVFLNGQLAAQSAREANGYLARVLGMDQRAFLASVCAQQKELTAFATMVPGDRRRLVLDLLGVSPVERALARVREQGRDAKTAATGARAGLPDLAELEAAAAEAGAELDRAALGTLVEEARDRQRVVARERRLLKELRAGLDGLPMVELPFLADGAGGPEEVRALAGHLTSPATPLSPAAPGSPATPAGLWTTPHPPSAVGLPSRSGAPATRGSGDAHPGSRATRGSGDAHPGSRATRGSRDVHPGSRASEGSDDAHPEAGGASR